MTQKFRLIFLSAPIAISVLVTACGPPTHINSQENVSLGYDGPIDLDNPTYSKTIAPLFNQKCNSCHQAGGMAPFSLQSHAAVRGMAKSIRAAVVSRRMPPPGVDNSGQCQNFSNATWLQQNEIDAVTGWFDTGMPTGGSTASLPPPKIPGLSDPKLILKMAKPYTPKPPDGGADDYRCFLLDPQQSEDTLITAIQVMPDQVKQVHHVIVFKPSRPESQSEAEKLDGADGSPGYPCFGSAGVPSMVVGMWAPGGKASELRDAETGALIGRRLEKGRKLIMQVHYNLGHETHTTSLIYHHPGHPHPDQSSIAIKLDKSALPSKWMVLANIWLKLDPGEADVVTDDEQGTSWWQMQHIIYERGLADEYVSGGGIISLLSKELIALLLNPPDARDFKVYAIAPHMHTAGRQLKVEKLVDGNPECMAHNPHFNFHWQGAANYMTPFRIGKDDRLKITCHFDTRGRTQKTEFGEGTEDEMCLAFLLVAE